MVSASRPPSSAGLASALSYASALPAANGLPSAPPSAPPGIVFVAVGGATPGVSRRPLPFRATALAPVRVASGESSSKAVGFVVGASSDERTPFLVAPPAASKKGEELEAVGELPPEESAEGEFRLDVERQKHAWFGYLMVIGCVAGMITSLVIGRGFADFSVNPMLGPSSAALVASGAKVTSLVQAGDYWRLVTPMWLHAGLIHLAANMNMLIRMGWPFERAIGTPRFVLIYLISGVFSMVFSSIFKPTSVTVGASGALFGILGALMGELFINCHLLSAGERCCNFIALFLSIGIDRKSVV